ncbi:HipA domain-containing protein [Acinetobacter piscicola]|uniref:HipA domain-containing protein n=1 Tax=Acinetobacter TaxID=469 RepID=UPI0029FEE747|nr:HipA domain-containing protein [Acinetobacter piscicola]
MNEFVCMEAVKACELEPPKTYLSENLETYVVERFDKNHDGIRLSYEDFTMLMKKSNDPDTKYNESYGIIIKSNTPIYR